jgi:HAMP domain-containing protein
VRRPDDRNRLATIRALFEHFDAREKALGLERGSAARSHAGRAAVVAAVALLVLVLAIVAIAILLARTVSLPVRRLARVAARLGAGELSARVPEEGQTEIGELARAFNSMAASLRDSRDELATQNAELEAQQTALERALDGLAQPLAHPSRVTGYLQCVEVQLPRCALGRVVGVVLEPMDEERELRVSLQSLHSDLLPLELTSVRKLSVAVDGLAPESLLDLREVARRDHPAEPATAQLRARPHGALSDAGWSSTSTTST